MSQTAAARIAEAPAGVPPEKMSDQIPAQQQGKQPGVEREMPVKPMFIRETYKGADKLKGKAAIITGGDSGIGRAVAVHFAREGADVCIVYLSEKQDAEDTKKLVEAEGRKCILVQGDVGKQETSKQAVDATVKEFGRLDILVNNASQQRVEEDFTKVSAEEIQNTFATNVFGYMYFAQAALPHLKEGASIINTTSINAYRGHGTLIPYSTTKGAELAFTRSLAQNLVSKGIRVNAVAPGPIYTPLIPSTMGGDSVESFGGAVPMKRPGQPAEVAPSYVFLASEDASYFSGQTLHPNGGTVVNA